jgi:ATP adenylyltransferase
MPLPLHSPNIQASLTPLLFRLEGGERSGASQPHKHLQFIPTENEDGPPIERLARAARIDKDGRCPSSLAFLSCE